MGGAAYFRAKAEQCRRLAKGLTVENDPARIALFEMAREFDAKAAVFEKLKVPPPA